MKVRNKINGEQGESSQFNTVGCGEIIVYYDSGDCSSEFIKDYEVYLGEDKWKDMQAAFADRDIIPDNFNTMFRKPHNENEKEKGYYD